MSMVMVPGIVWSETASAGTYAMRSCNVPGHSSAPLGSWRPTPAPSMAMADSCSADNGFSFVLPSTLTMGYLTRATIDLQLPSDARRVVSAEGLRVWTRTRLSGTGVFEATVQVILDSGVQTIKSIADGSEVTADPVEATVPQGARRLRLDLLCRGSDRPVRIGPDDAFCQADHSVPLLVQGIEVTLREDVLPSGSVAGGSVLEAAPVAGTRSLEYTASDVESGLAKIEAVIGETVVGARDLTSRCSYADFTACPTSDRDTLLIDTSKVANGRHPLSLRVFDAAGNRRDVEVQLVDVQNAQNAVAQQAQSRLGFAHLSAAFAGSSRSTLSVPFGRRVVIRGRLASPSNSGIAKAQLDVFERSARAGAREVAVGRAQTRSDGTFSYELAARRPSRVVRLAYGSSASSRRLQVRVHAAAALRATLRGRLLRFSGQVLSRPLPATGKLVRLEGVSTGFKWRRFATLRTDRNGRFSGRFRLAGRRPGARYYMRVRMPAERGYPYLAATGKPVRLRAGHTVPRP